MNVFLRKFFSLFTRLQKEAVQESKLAALRSSKKIILGKNVKILPGAMIPANIGKITIGDNTWIAATVNMFPHNANCELIIGDDCYLGDQSRLWVAKKITIGNRVLIAHNVNIFDTTTHPIDKNIRYQHETVVKTQGMPREKYDTIHEACVEIGDDVWIGCNSIILKGVTIGEGAIVCAGSTVVRDVPPNTMVAGNPAREIKRLQEY